ncbi:TPA: hypothetical protein DD394_05195 [bacterium UBP9_UBA11836]|nr:hypothetical protein [bacterium UBP9_UBA11836]
MKINWREMWSLEEPSPVEESRDKIEEDMQNIASSIVAIHLGVPVLWFLESCKPLSFIANQALVFFSPAANFIGLDSWWRKATAISSRRSNVDSFIEAIEQLEIKKNEQQNR